MVHNSTGPDINTDLWNGDIIGKDKALYTLALTAFMNPESKSSGGKFVRVRVIEHLRNLIRERSDGKSNEPSARGDLTGWKDIGQAFAIVFAKKTPQIWSELTADETEKLDWIMRAFVVSGNYQNNIRNWPSRCMYQTYSIGKTWNPNHNDGYVGIMIAGYYYFGGAGPVNKILSEFHYDDYISKFRELHFHNLEETWTAAGTKIYPIGKDEAFMKRVLENPDGTPQLDRGNGKVFGARIPFVFVAPPSGTAPVPYDPVKLYQAIAGWMFTGIVSNRSKSGSAYILNNGSSPVLGKVWMCREFQITDGFAPHINERSDAQYCWWGWMMHMTTVSAIMALGDWPKDGKLLETGRHLYVGSEDLMYKLKLGYHSTSKGAIHDHYDKDYDKQGYWLMCDIWNSFVKPRLNTPPVISVAAPDAHAKVDGKTVEINIHATDAEGYLTRVEFYEGPKKLGTESVFPFTFVWNKLTPGNHVITVKAYDDGGLESTISSDFNVVK